MKRNGSCPKCKEVGWCITCGHVNYPEGVYLSWDSKEDAEFILKNFVNGTKWTIYDHWGYEKAIITVVGDRVEGRRGKKLGQKVILQNGSRLIVDLDNLAAKPVA
ncbi:MAG TPA: hypothetical protein VMD74_05290 [Candidatus Methylomirabilis sp.]|nr:hypothetical protein [Candidatus Methylomirabilis sp.]